MTDNSILDFAKRLQQKTQQDRETVEVLMKSELDKLTKNFSEQLTRAVRLIASDIKTNLDSQQSDLKTRVTANEEALEKLLKSQKEKLTKQASLTYEKTLSHLKSTAKDSENLANQIKRSLKMQFLIPLVTFLICLMICAASWGVTRLFIGTIATQIKEIKENQLLLNQLPSGVKYQSSESGNYLIFNSDPAIYQVKSGEYVTKLPK